MYYDYNYPIQLDLSTNDSQHGVFIESSEVLKAAENRHQYFSSPEAHKWYGLDKIRVEQLKSRRIITLISNFNHFTKKSLEEIENSEFLSRANINAFILQETLDLLFPPLLLPIRADKYEHIVNCPLCVQRLQYNNKYFSVFRELKNCVLDFESEYNKISNRIYSLYPKLQH